MPANYVLLEKITVGAAGASSVTFSGIPQTGYTDLVVKISARTDAALGACNLSFNGGSSDLTSRIIFATGSFAGSASYASNVRAGYIVGTDYTTSTFANNEIYIPNYTSSNFKSSSIDSVTENNGTDAYSMLTAGLWSSTSAITSATLSVINNNNGAAANFVQGSTFYLYGVAKLGTTPAIVPYATGGDTIMTDGTYWYHTFVSSGTFTPQKGLSCDYLVVAGGGGGGDYYGGGGGAGGLRSTVTATGGGGSLESALSLGTSAYTVTIGAGGAGGTGNNRGTSGSNSVFATITSAGGGGGGSTNSGQLIGGNGGSGGGGGGFSTSQVGGSGTANQGFAGGTGVTDNASFGSGGGGGGAGAVGANAITIVAGNGGAGVATSISGSSVTYAGGGGGGFDTSAGSGTSGTGGSSIGGNGGNKTTAPTAGVANTGSGGGGAGDGTSINGALGGSGIVIVRYAV
jgi:hypothetical protein